MLKSTIRLILLCQKKTRGVERFNKLNVWGKVIPESFLFYRNTLNQKQKAVYDTVYKALMKNEEGADLPVGLSKEDFFTVMDTVQWDNPEAFWWADRYVYWTNSDDTVTNFEFKHWLENSELEKNMTNSGMQQLQFFFMLLSCQMK